MLCDGGINRIFFYIRAFRTRARSDSRASRDYSDDLSQVWFGLLGRCEVLHRFRGHLRASGRAPWSIDRGHHNYHRIDFLLRRWLRARDRPLRAGFSLYFLFC